ncbi:hypothetical protein [Halorhabdus amylolytica]|uniref:hypothetical protein n=1 Tax=Halorhabdus amylolytica TaxID=2559573 RepID=UPI0010A9FB3C|nr:hypothetical protein [Halorhabdus amylolytica]
MAPSSTVSDSNCGSPRRKSVLFCANCGHDSHVEGDWVLHERRGSRSVWYQCPECGHAVSVRPTRSLEESRLPSPISASSSRGTYGTPPRETPEVELWTDFWDTYRQMTTAWLRPWSDVDVMAD